MITLVASPSFDSWRFGVIPSHNQAFPSRMYVIVNPGNGEGALVSLGDTGGRSGGVRMLVLVGAIPVSWAPRHAEITRVIAIRIVIVLIRFTVASSLVS
jgi:hypothetical protein